MKKTYFKGGEDIWYLCQWHSCGQQFPDECEVSEGGNTSRHVVRAVRQVKAVLSVTVRPGKVLSQILRDQVRWMRSEHF